ncbi:mucoidy inhibitor MuiA family protein [Runella sp.]|uniref:mucoidy inhibitor MuiA family protein n=1 Tax=Runella sp. TaxID=1960881 RepID=UPI00262E977C|nr:mucoidy inhibitor MuiA family protein [Runella sp.]
MRKLFFCCMISLSVWAQKEPMTKVESKIETVTVYENGAQVTRTAKTNIVAGKTALILRGVSPQLDKQSLQANGDFTILSVVLQTSFLSDPKKAEERSRLEVQKENLDEKITLNKALITVCQHEEAMLTKNQEINGRTTVLKVTDLRESIDFHRNRLTELATKQLELNKTNRQLEQEIKKLNAQLTLLAPTQETTTSEIVVTVQSQTSQPQADLAVSYFVPNAGWTPTYDLRIKDVTHPLEMGYKATIYQYTGEDWNNIKLTLSTANPRKNNEAPELRTWYWGVPNNYSDYFNTITTTLAADNEIAGIVRSASDKTPLPGVTVLLKGTSLGTTTDANGNYRLTIPPDLKYKNKVLIFSFIGMKTQEINVVSVQQDVYLVEDTQQLQEVVVTGYSNQQRRELTGAVAGVQIKGKSTIPIVEETEAITSLQFEIKVPYTIPSDGKTYTVEIKNEEIPARYEYLCTPKIDQDAFLTAQVLNWEQYGLLGGDINVFFEGVFVGKSSMNLPNGDTLSLALGRDKGVSVSRVKQKEFTKKQTFGNSQTETRRYDISVRNLKKQPINLLIVDQFPLSRSKDIEVGNQSAPDADINRETGKVTWRVTLEPAQQRKFSLGYSVKYPKSGVISTE